jgi:hypothetical protein
MAIRLFLLLCFFSVGSAMAQTAPAPTTPPAGGTYCNVPTTIDNPFADFISKGSELIGSSKPIIYTLGTLAMLGIGIRAMYGGQMPWGWLFTVMSALVITSLVPTMCEWVFDQVKDKNVSTYADTANALKGAGDIMFDDTQEVMYGLGGIAAAALGIMGLFGKFPFKWLFALIAGLGIISAARGIVDYLTNYN